MKLTMFKRAVRETVTRFHHMRSIIMRQIADLPPNPNARRLGKNCQIVKFSETLDNLDPFFHDFEAQYLKIIEIIDEKHYDEIVPILEAIMDGKPYKKYKFHPKVIKNLRKALL